MHFRAPERLVDIDVPEPRDRALVEQRRLDRSAASLEPLREAARRERALERLAPEPLREVPVDVFGLEQVPGTEAAYVTIGDVRPVV